MQTNKLTIARTKKFLAVAMTTLLLLVQMPMAVAAPITNASNTLTNLNAGEDSNHSIVFTAPTGGVDEDGTVVVTFPGGFDLTGASVTALSVDATPQTIALGAPTTTDWGYAIAGQIVTLSTPTSIATYIAAGNNVAITLEDVENPAASGAYNIDLATTDGTVNIDTGTISVVIVDDSQVFIDAIVDNTFTFSIDQNNLSFGSLTTANARYATTGGGENSETEGHNIEVATNAANGYTVTLSGSTLTSGSNTIDAIGPTAQASDPGTEQFGLRLAVNVGDDNRAAQFNTADFAFEESPDLNTVLTTNAPASTAEYSVRYLANIETLTEAGTYSTTLTYIATANF